MPIYEYECQSCGTRLEVLQRFNDPPLEICECGEEGKLKKLISAPAFQFKGEGWYVTDYARKGANGKGDGADKGEKGSEGKEAKGSEAKGSEAKGSEAKGSEAKSKDSGAKAKESKSSSGSGKGGASPTT